MAENPRIEELRRRVQADPASIAFAALAEEFRRVGRYDDAIETCRTGLERHPAYLSARVTLGRALIETGDLDGAREELTTVLRSAPENLAAIRGLATIHERIGESSEMDPHLAQMMQTMHAESLRVPVQPPAPPEPAALEPGIAVWAAPAEPEPQSPPEPLIESELQIEPEPVFAAENEPECAAWPELDAEFDLSLPGPPAPPPELDLALMRMAVDPEPEVAVPEGPTPEMLATLARLERFLGAIQSLRP